MINKFHSVCDKYAVYLCTANVGGWAISHYLQVPYPEYYLALALYWAIHHWLFGQEYHS